LQFETPILQIAATLQSAPYYVQHRARAGHYDHTQMSRSIASNEAKAKLTTACLDSNSNFAVFARSKIAVMKAQEILLINRHF